MLKEFMRRINQWSRIQRDISRVRQLDDHLLDDMGIARERIAARVSGRSRV